MSLLWSKQRERVVLGEVLVEPVLLIPAKLRETDLLKERIEEAFRKSPQLGILLGLYFYCKRNPKGARPKDLHQFLVRLGINVRDNCLRAELSYLKRKGAIVKEAGRYRVRSDLRLEGLVKLVDTERSKAGKARWINSKCSKDWRPKHSLRAGELLQRYNAYNLRERIKALIRRGEDMKALALLVCMGGGLRPSDRIIELGYREGSFYAIVYEGKCDRYRLICEVFDDLWRELLREEEIRRWLLEILNRHKRRIWRLTNEDWLKISSSISKSKKKVGRRVYLCYQMLGGQAYLLAVRDERPLIIGIHANPLNDEYYISR